jgi:hypothetical protein
MKRNNLNEVSEFVNQSLYPNLKFKDKIVGNSTPTKDKINPSLLADIQKAAKIANVGPIITTAVSGHKNSGRHPYGNAVDIAMFRDKGFSSERDAQSKGIYQDIVNFVNALVSMGYVKNQESNNDKAVLTFGFPGHDNHVHVSRKSGGDTSPVTGTSSGTNTATNSSDTDNTDGKSLLRSVLTANLGLDKLSQGFAGLQENINRIKNLMK